ncbi:MAG: cytochrome ubiquinol oxidase subunit I [Gammaproteobacteria bacterium]|nr:cytochrome ubiquinol oxidase subunit I [Gammaproteobacteria bacterium]
MANPSNDFSWAAALAGVRNGIVKISILLVVVYAVISLVGLFLEPADYRQFPLIESRVIIWCIAQGHLMFGAFVLGVPIFVLIAEIIGVASKSEQYDRMAKEFTRLLAMSYTLTAFLGGLLLIGLMLLYPRFVIHMRTVFEPTWFWYLAIIFMEVFFAYLYWYSWDLLKNRKGLHIFIGVMVNLFGLAILLMTNAWTGYMMTPEGVEGRDIAITVTDRLQAFTNYTWIPLNIHRFIANVCFGGAIVGAYAAFRFLCAESDEERARFDWMGYVGSFIAVSAFIPLPFAGYYFGMEIYHYSQQMGVSMMGGSFAQLWYLQAILIGALFLGINLYLWLGMNRIPGGERYRKFQIAILVVIATGFAVWATPHSISATVAEMRAMGGTHHPKLGVLGLMSAKNTAVNMMILATFLNFMLYRRGNMVATTRWSMAGKTAQLVGILATVGIVVGYGIYGYFVPIGVSVGFSVYMVLAVLGCIFLFLLIEFPMYKGARSLGEIQWGKMPERSQYVLFFLAVSFTWLMGLMGYIRSGIRQYWHVYGVMQDTSTGAFTPTHGFATGVVSVIVFVFFLLIAMVFALAMRSERKEQRAS